MIRDKMDSGVNARITGNTRINATGQAVEGDSDGGSSAYPLFYSSPSPPLRDGGREMGGTGRVC
ncbi:hypothetical protein FA13DRAFT_1737747 [Coprinellus micaceus]|uniref:Uncharacterized protein n=1 Tax=Coprinellus micaceus TaxID=71717 RepID=A0A4Y7SXY4_COPMI|nr:hypothetical protein FA13DRAFT_1737747 [Coprinellus micaceus]